MKSDQERVSKLLTDTVTLLCKNGLVYNQEIKVQGLLGVTVDKKEVFIVHMDELIGGSVGGGSTSERSGTVTSAESPARKRNTAMNTGKVVDLTRVADTTCPPHPPSFSNQASPGRSMMVRKPRPPVPATMMLPEQRPIAPRMQQHMSPRPKMNPAAMQNASGKQLAANYLAQLKQHVARSVSPARMMSPPRQPRPVNRRPQQMMAVAMHSSSTDDDGADDDDVVIVGTGHEEPAPSWSSPMRKRPLPSHLSTSPAPPQKRAAPRLFHSPGQKRAAHDLMEQLSSADMAEALELTMDDIPTSVEDIIKKIAPTTPQKPVSHPGMPVQGSPVSIKISEQVNQNIPGAVVMASSEPGQMDLSFDVVTECVLPAVGVAEDVSEAATVLQQPVPSEDKEAAAAEPLQPFVYTDFACDVDEIGQNDTLADSDVAGLAVHTSDESPPGKVTDGSCNGAVYCQIPGCTAVCADPAELANHYTTVHSPCGELAIPPSVIVPTNLQPDNGAVRKSPASDNVELDANGRPGIACPFDGCGMQIASYPGLVMHHRHVHGVSLPADQCREMAAAYRTHREEAAVPCESNVAVDTSSAGSAAHAATSAEACDSFVCPFSSCGVWSFSREDLIAHMHLNHSESEVTQPCKQEADDSMPTSQ